MTSWEKWEIIEIKRIIAVSSSARQWIDVLALTENSNMAVTENDPDPKVRKMSIIF